MHNPNLEQHPGRNMNTKWGWSLVENNQLDWKMQVNMKLSWRAVLLPAAAAASVVALLLPVILEEAWFKIDLSAGRHTDCRQACSFASPNHKSLPLCLSRTHAQAHARMVHNSSVAYANFRLSDTHTRARSNIQEALQSVSLMVLEGLERAESRCNLNVIYGTRFFSPLINTIPGTYQQMRIRWDGAPWCEV